MISVQTSSVRLNDERCALRCVQDSTFALTSAHSPLLVLLLQLYLAMYTALMWERRAS